MNDSNFSVAQIIQQRRPLAQRIEAVEQNLRSLSSMIEQLETYRLALRDKAEDDNVIASLNEIELSDLQQSFRDELSALSKLKARFNRDTLNIGVVGRARQGKSRLLQSLTQLTKAEIPDGDRQHCTGVRSTIYHQSEINPYGKVVFYTEQSLLTDVIAPYYEELNLGEAPASMNDFITHSLSPLPEELRAFAEPKAKYEYLRRYRSKYDKYRPLLQKESPYEIKKNQIREYVAQDNLGGERVYFNYLAVKEVEIFCSFLNDSITQVALIDMPGLGDTGVGAEERMIQSLGQDVDILLFVRMPKASGDSWMDVDVKLYDTALKSLVDLPIDQWAFQVINRTDQSSKNGDNSNNCEDLKRDIASSINVVDSHIINCSSTEESSKLLSSVLNYLIDNIQRLDRQYSQARQQSLLLLQARCQDILLKAQPTLARFVGHDQLYSELFRDFWKNLRFELNKFKAQVKAKQGSEDEEFKRVVGDILHQCRESVTISNSPDVLRQGKYLHSNYTAYYNDLLWKTRTDLSAHFLRLDGQIQRYLDNLKLDLTKILVNGLNLKLATADSPQTLTIIANLVENHLRSGSNLELGFRSVADFNVSFAGVIQRNLRQSLDKLDADSILYEGQLTIPFSKEQLIKLAEVLVPIAFKAFIAQASNPGVLELYRFLVENLKDLKNEDLSDPSEEQARALGRWRQRYREISEDDATQILERLQGAYQHVLAECEEKLNKLAMEPSYIAYAMVAEFVDRVTLSGEKEAKEVSREWEVFLRQDDIKLKVWDQFDQLNQRQQERDNWIGQIDQILARNEISHYQFLN